jgi:hypothetical protein
LRYLATLPNGKIALWCFLIWYLVTVCHHFDPTPAIWLNALGLSAIIGLALNLSVREPGRAPPDRWTVARLFMMPFCVSSFSQLIKGKGFVLVVPPDVHELTVTLATCGLFVLLVFICRRIVPVGAR